MDIKIYSKHYLRRFNKVDLALLASYELLRTKIAEYQWKVNHGAPCLSPEQIEMYESEVERLLPLLERMDAVL